MRYGNPSIASALRCLRDQNASRIIVLPLFPQYSGPTSGSIFDAVMAEVRSWRTVPDLVFIHSYHDHPAYIQTVADKIKQNLAGRSPSSQLLLSFHGMPRIYIERGDPYHQECIRTARLIASASGSSRYDVADKFPVPFWSARVARPIY